MQDDKTIEPTAPVEPVTPAQTEDDEWTGVAADFMMEKNGVKPVEEVKNVPGSDENKTPEGAPKPGEDKVSDDTKGAESVSSDNPAIREQRGIQRELAEDQKLTREEIRKEVFGDVPTELADADGDPIRTVADVQKLMNPNTNKPFTEDEATLYLLQAQNHLSQQIETTNKQVEQIADIQLSLKDQSDSIRAKYGELLKSMPELQKELWAEFEKTLERHPDTDIITKAPVSLERFYDTALRGYARSAELEAANAKAQAQAKADVEKVQTRSDRQDIYGAGRSSTTDAEADEWAQAAKLVYER